MRSRTFRKRRWLLWQAEFNYTSACPVPSPPPFFTSPPHSSTSWSSASCSAKRAGRWAAPLWNRCRCHSADQLAGMLLEQRDLFPFPRETPHITSTIRSTSTDPRLGTSPIQTLQLPADSMRSCLCVRRPAGDGAVGNSVLSDPFFQRTKWNFRF